MFTELNNLLNFDEKTPPNGQTILVTESGVEGTFVIHHLISLYLRGGHNVCLVSFAHSFNHYSNVATKLGVKLNTAKENGNFTFLGGLDVLGKGIVGHCKDQSDKNDLLPLQQILVSSAKDYAVKALYNVIETTYKSLKDWQSTPTLLLVDDLSMLVHLGVLPMDLVWLMQYLQNFTCNSQAGNGCLVSLVHGETEEEDEDITFLVKSLQHRSDVNLSVTGLPSGYSKEVHGQIHMKWNNVEQHEPAMSTTKTAQFKIGDKNVVFFAKGMSSAVL